MENLWSGTDSGLSKDWDDEFDDIETAITYEFPYAELASQPVIPPAPKRSRNLSSKKPLKVPDEVKDGNIWKSSKTYSKKRRNPLFFQSEISPSKGGNKLGSSPKIQNTKTPQMKQLEKSQDKGISVKVANPSEAGDCSKGKAEMSVIFNDFSKKETMNNVIHKPHHNDVNHLEYSLFGDIEGCSSHYQSEESTTNCTEELSITLNERSKTAYQRTRKNLKQQINNNKMLQSVTNNFITPSMINAFRSESILDNKKRKQDSEDSNHSASGSDADEALDFQPSPPKKQPSLMDMLQQYEEVQNSQSKSGGTSKRKKKPTKKSQNCKTAKATDIQAAANGICNKLRNSRLSVASNNTDSSQSEKNSLSLTVKSPRTRNKTAKEQNEYVQEIYPVAQLPTKRYNGRLKGNMEKSVKKVKAPPKKRQPRARKLISVQCSKTDDELDANLSAKHAQSPMSNSICSRSRTQSVLYSATANSQTVVANQLLPPNIETHPTTISNSSHPVAPPTMSISKRRKISLKVQNISEKATVKSNYQFVAGPFSMNPSTSVHHDPSPELNTSDSEFEMPVVNNRTFSLHGADFLSAIFSKMESISKSCVVQCLEVAEDWIAETPYSRELTVKEFCNNPLVMNVLLEFLNDCPDYEKLLKLEYSTKVLYEFPEDFQNVPLYRMLKDYVDQVLQQMVPPNFSPTLTISNKSVLKFAFSKMQFRECVIMTLLFKKVEELKLADIAAKLNFVAMLVIFDEFRQRDIVS